jgi:hypothetical protein
LAVEVEAVLEVQVIMAQEVVERLYSPKDFQQSQYPTL